MSPKLLLSSLLLLTLISASTQRTSHTAQISATSEIGRTPLWMYGQYVYKREGCADCHTQDIGDSSRKISLDGLSARYSDDWTFEFLVRPDIYRPGCGMPNCEFLLAREQDPNILPELLNTDNEIRIKINAQKLDAESFNYYEDLIRHDSRLNYNSEILALLYYIRQIPKSQNLIARDSLWAIANNLGKESIEQKLENPDWDFYKMPDTANLTMLESGQKLFKTNCQHCHKIGQVLSGPAKRDSVWLKDKTNKDLARTIFLGSKYGMPPFKGRLSSGEVASIVAYLRKN